MKRLLDMIKDLDKTLSAADKRKLQNALYKALDSSHVTGHYYHDESWQGVRDVNDVLEKALADYSKKNGVEFELSIYCKDGGYRKSNDGLSQWKEYIVEVYVKGKEVPTLVGTLNCHAAGTQEDPFKAYDMSCVISY